MKKLIQLSATPALLAGMAALTSGSANAQSFLDDVTFHIGATGGAMAWEAEHHDDGGTNWTTDGTLAMISAIAGVDTRSGDWLFGIEGDIGIPLGEDLDDPDIPGLVQWSDMNYDAHLRARIGHRFGAADVFIAGGLAITELEQKDKEFDVHETKTLTGFSIGGGVDWPVAENLTARVEILYDDYGTVDTAGDFSGYTGDWSDTTVRGGLLFTF